MKKISFVLFMLIFLQISCKKKQEINIDNSHRKIVIENKADSLKKIKDTTLFINSSEGEEVSFYINSITKDSIITSEVMGETGKSDYKFVFNKNLKSGECKTYRYAEPIYINSDPKITSQKIEKLSSSIEANKRLSNLFNSYKNILIGNYKTTPNNQINTKWLGKYKLVIDENSDDWRNIKEVELNISKDSVNYIAKGYQLYQNFKLSAIEKNNSLQFTFENAEENTDSWALEKTKDFGTLKFDGKKYIWSSPYMNINFSDNKETVYELKK